MEKGGQKFLATREPIRNKKEREREERHRPQVCIIQEEPFNTTAQGVESLQNNNSLNYTTKEDLVLRLQPVACETAGTFDKCRHHSAANYI